MSRRIVLIRSVSYLLIAMFIVTDSGLDVGDDGGENLNTLQLRAMRFIQSELSKLINSKDFLLY